MIYLFTNRTFGARFLETAARWKADRSAGLTVVLSDRTQQDGLRSRLSHALSRRRLRRELGLPVLIVDDVNGPKLLRRIRPGDRGVIAGFNQIFKKRAIRRFDSLVNFHPSLLPYYRGPIPAHWCLENGETTTGYSLHRVVQRIDAGEVLWQETVPIEPGDRVETLTERIAGRAQPVFERYLASLVGGEPLPVTLVDAASVYRVRVDYRSFPERPL